MRTFIVFPSIEDDDGSDSRGTMVRAVNPLVATYLVAQYRGIKVNTFEPRPDQQTDQYWTCFELPMMPPDHGGVIGWDHFAATFWRKVV